MVLTREEILDGLRELAKSQGFYTRLYERLMDASDEDRECFLSHIEDINPRDMVDVVMYLEC